MSKKSKRARAYNEAHHAAHDPAGYLFDRTGWFMYSEQEKPTRDKLDGAYCFLLGLTAIAAFKPRFYVRSEECQHEEGA